MTVLNASSTLPPELTLLSQEISNRYAALSYTERRNPCAALIRITVEVTRQFLKDDPERVEEYLRLYAAQQRSLN